VTAAVTLLFLIVPNWKPEGPVTEVDATISVSSIEPNVTLEEYARRIGQQEVISSSSGESTAAQGVATVSPGGANRVVGEDAKAQASFNAQSAYLQQFSPESTGYIVSFDIEVVGYRGRNASLIWSLYDAETNQRVAESGTREQPVMDIPVEYATDRASADVWIPGPEQPGRYYARLELYNDRQTRIASVSSEPFVVR
jgi:hypothetical protein